MIRASSTMVPDSRTPEKGSKWRAEATVNGQTFVGVSRNGATCELARILVAAGLPDDEMELYTAGKLALTIRSFHRHAQRTYREGPNEPLHSVRWYPYPDAISRGSVKPKTGGE